MNNSLLALMQRVAAIREDAIFAGLVGAIPFNGVAKTGTAAADSIMGDKLNDRLLGGAGDDQLYGQAGDDVLDGSLGNDTLSGEEGNDLVRGGDGNDVLIDGAGNDRLFGASGNDTLTGWGGNNLFDGGDGDDKLSDGAGSDTLLGGAGNDLLGTGGIQSETVSISVLSGGDGDDVFTFATGVASKTAEVSGGSGSDRFQFAYGTHLQHNTITDFQAGIGGDQIDLPSVESAASNPFGSAASLRLLQSGNDTLLQLDLDGAAGARDGFHTLVTLRGVTATSLHAANFVAGYQPDGSDSTRYIVGTAGKDTILAGYRNDTVMGGLGDDSLYGGNGNDQLIGGDGNDTLDGEEGDDRTDGGAGADTLNGGYGNDKLNGGAGNDVIKGGWGNDQLIGGGGDDVMTGGDGTDTYLLPAGQGSGSLAVTDFVPGAAGDRIDVTALLSAPAQGAALLASGVVRFVQSNSATLVQFDADGSAGAAEAYTVLILQNFAASTLTADNLVYQAVAPGAAAAPVELVGVADDALAIG